MSHMRLILAAVLVPAAVLASVPSSAMAQARTGTNAPPTGVSPRDISRVRAEFARVRQEMESVQRDFDRAARTNNARVRDEALKEWQRALDGLEPFVAELSADVPDEQPFIEQFNQWQALYQQAADPALAGEFFLQISKYWSEVTAGTEGWDQEKQPPSFDEMLKAEANDPQMRTLGMPKTVAFVNASNTYIQNVTAREDYPRFKAFPNVRGDMLAVRAARGQAHDKLVKAADQILTEAGNAKLDQAGRDRLDRFVEQDLPTALAGYEGRGKVLARGRQLVYNYDKATLGESAAAEKSLERLTAAAQRDWPTILTQYSTLPMPPVGSGRGHVVHITGAKNLIGKEFGISTYDFGGYVDGAPAVGNFAPGVREHVNDVLAQTNLKTLPEDIGYEMVAVVRGTAQVPNVRRAGATTAPATATPEVAATAPAVTDCVILDIVALRAGPVAVGSPVVVTPVR